MRLVEFIDSCEKSGRLMPPNSFAELRSELALLQNKNSWISVKDRLPERSSEIDWCSLYVLVASALGPGIGHYDYDQECWIYSPCGKMECTDNRVTHWMPIPEPPKEGKHV